MEDTEPLSELIHSLSKADKRFFSLFADREKGDKIYLQLYNDLKNKNPDRNVSSHQLPDLKKYLYKLLLSSLHTQYAETTIDFKLYKLLHLAGVLLYKGLYAQTHTLIRKAKKLAYLHERISLIPELLYLETFVSNVYGNSSRGENNTLEQIHATQILLNLFQYRNLNYQFLSQIRKSNTSRTANQKRVLKKIMQHPLLVKKNTLSIMAEYSFYTTWGLYHSVHNDLKNMKIILSLQLNLVESHPKKFENKELTHFQTLHNLFLCQMKLKNFKDASTYVEKIKKIKAPSELVRNVLFLNAYNNELELLIQSGQFENALPLLNIQESKFMKASAEQKIMIYGNTAYIYFATAHFREALQWIMKIVNSPGNDAREDIQSSIRIMYLIVRFEIASSDSVLKNIARSTRYFLEKRNTMFRTEKLIVDFFYKTLKEYLTKKEFIRELKKVRQELLNIFQKYPDEKITQDSFDVLSWINSKIENKSFAELVRARVATTSTK